MGAPPRGHGSIAMAAAVAILLCGENGALAQATVPYSNQTHGYALLYPAGWETRLMGGAMVFLSQAESPVDAFRENVNVVIEDLPTALTPAQYAALGVPNMQQSLSNFMLVEQGQGTINNQPASFVVYRHTMGQDLMVIAFFFVRGTRAYVVTGTAAAADFARWRPIFAQIANTFGFI